MACATLKRTLDFDPLHSPSASPKRRRCTPLMSPSTPTSSTMSTSCRQPSPFSPFTPTMSPGQLAANICLEWKRIKRRRHLSHSYGDSNLNTEVSDPNSHVMDMIHQSSSTSSMPPGVTHPYTGCGLSLSNHSFPVGGIQQNGSSSSSSSSSSGRDQPMFTLKQVILICERMLKEQESRTREEYDKVLSHKLAEQYDAFVKFNQDQARQRFRDSTASYVS